jgi:hypothetical protein
MTRLQTKAQCRAALETSLFPSCSAARRARVVSSVRPGARGAKFSSSVRFASGHEAEPAAKLPAKSLGREATSAAIRLRHDLPSLRHLLCLHCAKHAAVDPGSCCSFDKENSKMCSYYCGQKNKCFPVSILLSCFFLMLI